MRNHVCTGLVAAAFALGLSAPAHAGSVIFDFARNSLTNVVDAAGSTQYEAGTLSKGGTSVGSYQIERRSTTGSGSQNAAQTRITLFLFVPASGAQQTVLIEGAHEFTLGNFAGSVAATAPRYAYMRGGDATATSVANTGYHMTITWPGVFPVPIP